MGIAFGARAQNPSSQQNNDTIPDLAGNPLGGPGAGNGDFNEGPAILPIAGAASAIALILLALGFIRLRRKTA